MEAMTPAMASASARPFCSRWQPQLGCNRERQNVVGGERNLHGYRMGVGGLLDYTFSGQRQYRNPCERSGKRHPVLPRISRPEGVGEFRNRREHAHAQTVLCHFRFYALEQRWRLVPQAQITMFLEG
jgi:hypothetical protein